MTRTNFKNVYLFYIKMNINELSNRIKQLTFSIQKIYIYLYCGSNLPASLV